MNGIPLEHFLLLAVGLFGLGIFGVLSRRNAISVLMGIELMLNGVSVNFLAFARHWGWNTLAGPVFVVFVITIAAAEVAIALAIIITLYRNLRSSDVGSADGLKG